MTDIITDIIPSTDTLLYVYNEYDKVRKELQELKQSNEVAVTVTCVCGITTVEQRKVLWKNEKSEELS